MLGFEVSSYFCVVIGNLLLIINQTFQLVNNTVVVKSLLLEGGGEVPEFTFCKALAFF